MCINLIYDGCIALDVVNKDMRQTAGGEAADRRARASSAHGRDTDMTDCFFFPSMSSGYGPLYVLYYRGMFVLHASFKVVDLIRVLTHVQLENASQRYS